MVRWGSYDTEESELTPATYYKTMSPDLFPVNNESSGWHGLCAFRWGWHFVCPWVHSAVSVNKYKRQADFKDMPPDTMICGVKIVWKPMSVHKCHVNSLPPLKNSSAAFCDSVMNWCGREDVCRRTDSCDHAMFVYNVRPILESCSLQALARICPRWGRLMHYLAWL